MSKNEVLKYVHLYLYINLKFQYLLQWSFIVKIKFNVQKKYLIIADTWTYFKIMNLSSFIE